MHERLVELDDGKPTLFVYGLPPDVEVSVPRSKAADTPGARKRRAPRESESRAGPRMPNASFG